MLKLVVQLDDEGWDEVHEVFIEPRYKVLQLEHSLVSISKWESKWHKSFLSTLDKKGLSLEETVDYIKCMTLTTNVDSEVYEHLTTKHIQEVQKYIVAPMTATVINDPSKSSGQQDVLTSEVLYYYMITLNIPFECQKWHLNRLITLIRVCNIKNKPPKKMSKREIMNRNKALNAERRKQMNTKG